MQYPEKCEACGAPARWITLSDEAIGVEEFKVCVNVGCPMYDRRQAELEGRQRTIRQNQIAVGEKRPLPLEKLLNPVDEVSK